MANTELKKKILKSARYYGTAWGEYDDSPNSADTRDQIQEAWLDNWSGMTGASKHKGAFAAEVKSAMRKEQAKRARSGSFKEKVITAPGAAPSSLIGGVPDWAVYLGAGVLGIVTFRFMTKHV